MLCGQVFSLTSSLAKTRTFFQSAENESIDRLASFFNVSSGGLKDQLDRLRPLGQKDCKESHSSAKDAWVATMLATQNRGSMKDSSKVKLCLCFKNVALTRLIGSNCFN